MIFAINDSTVVTLVYDGDGNRVRKTVNGTTTHYLVDDPNPTGYVQVLEEQAAEGGNPTVIYTCGLDLVSQNRGGTVFYFGYDGQGSARYLSSTGGTATDTYVYDAFGILLSWTGQTVNNYRYTGEQWDPDLGMYYLRANITVLRLGGFG